jgi:hypothetical protein
MTDAPTERKSCFHCRFWHPWKTVMMADDVPQPLGHCIVVVDISPSYQEVYTHGLTANDFFCDAFKDVDQ